MVSERGQEEAPFELLIAVIVMGLVIFLGLQVMTKTTTEQCKAQIGYNANQLKVSVEKAVAGGIETASFYPPRCFTKPGDGSPEMRFVVINDRLQCSRLCGSALNECFVFIYDSQEYNYRLCLQGVSPQTMFPVGESCSDTLEGRLVPVNLMESIPRGSIELISQSGTGSPVVCAYILKT